MAGILDSTKINLSHTYQQEISKFFWGNNAQFLSQNYIAAQNVYLLLSTQTGPYSYTLSGSIKDKVFDAAPKEDFHIEGTYCSYHLFARNISRYIGQPILAIVESSKEKAQEVAALIQVEYEEPDESIKPVTLSEYAQENILFGKNEQSPNFQSIFNSEENTILNFYYDTPTQYNVPNCTFGAYAFIGDDARMNVYVSTDWPSHVHKHVAECLGKDKDSVIIHPLTQGRLSNNLLIEPTLWACYAAIAAQKTAKPCKLLFSPAMAKEALAPGSENKIHIQIALDPEKKILACKTHIAVAAGYQGYFMDEYLAQIYDLFTHMYQFPEYALGIDIVQTSQRPRGAYLSSCRAGLQCAMESMLNQISRFYNHSPDQLRLALIHMNNEQRTHIMEQLFSRVLEHADFQRKNLAYHMEAEQTIAHFFDEQTTISLPLRGIGLSCAMAARGLLTSAYQKVTLSAQWPAENEKLTIKINSLPHNLYFIAYWKHMLSGRLGINVDAIEILAETHTEGGPYALGMSVGKIDPLMSKLCDNLKKKLKTKKFPLNYSLSREDDTQPVRQTSQEHAMMTCVVEVMIDPIEFKIKIVHLDFALYCGLVRDEATLRAYFSTALIQTLQWIFHTDAGPQSIWRADFSVWPGFNLNIVPNSSREASLSALPVTGLIQSTLPSAYLTAVSQAVNQPVPTFPVFPETIFNILKPDKEDES